MDLRLVERGHWCACKRFLESDHKRSEDIYFPHFYIFLINHQLYCNVCMKKSSQHTFMACIAKTMLPSAVVDSIDSLMCSVFRTYILKNFIIILTFEYRCADKEIFISVHKSLSSRRRVAYPAFLYHTNSKHRQLRFHLHPPNPQKSLKKHSSSYRTPLLGCTSHSQNILCNIDMNKTIQ
jgi:hypothetical protein